MITGVLTVEFRPSRTSKSRHTIRILVRNAEHLIDAVARGVATAIEIAPTHAEGNRAVATDWQRIDIDAVT